MCVCAWCNKPTRIGGVIHSCLLFLIFHYVETSRGGGALFFNIEKVNQSIRSAPFLVNNK